MTGWNTYMQYAYFIIFNISVTDPIQRRMKEE